MSANAVYVRARSLTHSCTLNLIIPLLHLIETAPAGECVGKVVSGSAPENVFSEELQIPNTQTSTLPRNLEFHRSIL
jgi:hypothetical protein